MGRRLDSMRTQPSPHTRRGAPSHDGVIGWFHEHPDAARGDADRLVVRAEQRACRHAREDACLEARNYIEARMHAWEHGWGFHASDAYVALEVCPMLAEDLRSHERHVAPEDAPHLVGRRMLAMFDDRGRRVLTDWIIELGEREHHRAWEDIVRFTRRRGRDLVRSGRMPHNTLDWEHTANFAEKAAAIASILVDELEARATAIARH